MHTFTLAILAALSLGFTRQADAQKARVRPAAQAKKATIKAKAAAKPRTTARRAAKKVTPGEGLLSPRGAASRTIKLAKEYTKAQGLGAPRVIEMGPTSRRIKRVFVPILPETQEAFQAKFSASGGNGSILLRHTVKNKHIVMAVEPGDLYLWGLNKWNSSKPGYQDLRRSYMQWDGTRSTWEGSTIAVYPTSVKALKGYLAKNEASGKRCEGHCMVWLPNATTGAKGETLFHDLGIKRSKEGDNMRAKIVHSGNHRVGVVGIHVTSLEAFKNMSDAQIQGKIPDKGVDQAMVQ